MDHTNRNHIPSGRQIPRTPPLKDFSLFHLKEKHHVKVEIWSNGELDVQTETEPEWSMLKDMKDYQMTADDLDFITKFKSEKRIKKLKAELEDLQKLLKKETMALEISCASMEKVQAELNKLPTCEDIITCVKVVHKVTELQDMDVRSLLDMVTVENIHNAIEEKKSRLTHMRKMEEERRKKEAEDMGEIEKHITDDQVKILELMRELSNLKSELSQQKEANKSIKKMSNTNKEGDKIQQKRGGKKSEEKQGRSKNTRRKAEETTTQKEPVQRGKKKAVAPTDVQTKKEEVVENVTGLRRSKRIANRK